MTDENKLGFNKILYLLGFIIFCFCLITVYDKQVKSKKKSERLLQKYGFEESIIPFGKRRERVGQLLVESQVEELMSKSALENTYQTVTISFESCSLIYNDHVGNEWDYYLEYDGQVIEILQTKEFIINGNEVLIIKAVLGETEEKYNDYNEEYISIDLTGNIDDEFLISQSVILREGNGRYAGNTAKFDFNVKINLN